MWNLNIIFIGWKIWMPFKYSWTPFQYSWTPIKKNIGILYNHGPSVRGTNAQRLPSPILEHSYLCQDFVLKHCSTHQHLNAKLLNYFLLIYKHRVNVQIMMVIQSRVEVSTNLAAIQYVDIQQSPRFYFLMIHNLLTLFNLLKLDGNEKQSIWSFIS